MPLIVLVLFVVIELTTAYAIEPWLYGSHGDFVPRYSGLRRVLDRHLGTGRIGIVHSSHGVPGGARETRAAARVPVRAAGRCRCFRTTYNFTNGCLRRTVGR